MARKHWHIEGERAADMRAGDLFTADHLLNVILELVEPGRAAVVEDLEVSIPEGETVYLEPCDLVRRVRRLTP